MSKQLTVKLRQLQHHPARDRSFDDPNELDGLTLQVASNKLDDWNPIVVAPADDEEMFNVISGNRRTLAILFGEAVRDCIADPDTAAAYGIVVEDTNDAASDSDEAKSAETAATMNGQATNDTIAQSVQHNALTIDLTCQVIQTLVGQYDGCVATTATALLPLYGEREVDVFLFDGDKKAEILAIQRGNANRLDPDPLGRATSFCAALNAGATPGEIARNSGVHINFVYNHLALAQVDPTFAHKVADGTFTLSMAQAVSELPKLKRQGVTNYLMEREPHTKFTVQRVKELVSGLKTWHGPQLPLTNPDPALRNLLRIIIHLWNKVVSSEPDRAWSFAAFLSDSGDLDDFVSDNVLTSQFIAHFGGAAYIDEHNIYWDKLLTECLPQISCTTCPIGSLPARQLDSDLPNHIFGVEAYPCRSHSREMVRNCLFGLTEDDPFRAYAPWEWEGYEGVTRSEYGNLYQVSDIEVLRTAWQKQLATEQAEQMVTLPEDKLTFSLKSTVAEPAFEGWTVYQHLTMHGSHATMMAVQAERADDDTMLRTACYRDLDALADALDHAEYARLTADEYLAEPIIIRQPKSVASFERGVFDEQPDVLLNASDNEEVESFYQQQTGWQLWRGIHHYGRYYYGHRPSGQLPTKTRCHDSIDGVLFDIDPDLVSAEIRDAIEEQATASPTSTDPISLETLQSDNPPAERPQHAKIRAFMQRHTEMNYQHPFATPCASCVHKRDSSPIKSNAKAPHCFWAKGARKIVFAQLIACDDADGFAPVPVCRQYAPDKAWRDLIPAFAGKVTMPRDWIEAQLLTLVNDAASRSQTSYGVRQIPIYPFEFLTGRPLTTKDSHRSWFEEQFEAQKGDLSDKQLWTLFVWAFAEYHRVCGGYSHSIALPVNGTSQQFVPVQMLELKPEKLAPLVK